MFPMYISFFLDKFRVAKNKTTTNKRDTYQQNLLTFSEVNGIDNALENQPGYTDPDQIVLRSMIICVDFYII